MKTLQRSEIPFTCHIQDLNLLNNHKCYCFPKRMRSKQTIHKHTPDCYSSLATIFLPLRHHNVLLMQSWTEWGQTCPEHTVLTWVQSSLLTQGWADILRPTGVVRYILAVKKFCVVVTVSCAGKCFNCLTWNTEILPGIHKPPRISQLCGIRSWLTPFM